MRSTVAALVTVVLLGGCGSGSAPHVPSPVGAATSHAASAVGGLIGAIDQARLEAVCENARQADTALAGGLGAAAAEPFVVAAAGLLERPPVVTAAHQAAARVRVDLRAGRRDLAVRELTRFCRAHGG